MGAVEIPAYDVFRILLYNILGIPVGDPGTLIHGVNYDIVWNIRAPRVFMAVIVGISLALAGVVMQATAQNPLADPYILGISSGASLGATFSIAVGAGAVFNGVLSGTDTTFWAFVGAMVASLAVLSLSSAGGRITSVKLVLSGMIIASLLGAFTNMIVVMAADSEEIHNLTFWLLGSLASATWTKIWVPLVCMAGCLIFFATQIRSLNTMMSGDETATTLGLDIAKKRKMYVFAAAILTASTVSACGMIGFVGLMIPHIVRSLTGNNHWKLLPVCCIAGGLFMVLADVLARTLVSGLEIPIGIITAFCGAPVFAYIMIKRSYSFGG
jgi:iron complex transport system permease protein